MPKSNYDQIRHEQSNHVGAMACDTYLVVSSIGSWKSFGRRCLRWMAIGPNEEAMMVEDKTWDDELSINAWKHCINRRKRASCASLSEKIKDRKPTIRARGWLFCISRSILGKKWRGNKLSGKCDKNIFNTAEATWISFVETSSWWISVVYVDYNRVNIRASKGRWITYAVVKFLLDFLDRMHTSFIHLVFEQFLSNHSSLFIFETLDGLVEVAYFFLGHIVMAFYEIMTTLEHEHRSTFIEVRSYLPIWCLEKISWISASQFDILY